MKTVLNFIDGLPVVPLVAFSVLLGLAPFSPEPHLWEKVKMLGAGTLVRPVDIFDLLMHGSGLLLCLFKFLRLAYLKQKTE